MSKARSAASLGAVAALLLAISWLVSLMLPVEIETLPDGKVVIHE